ncbi:MAG: PHP domain-containing protein, partial [Pseudomonadota bacterium]
MSAVAELAVATNFSFLRGASHPEEMVETAADLGLAGIGVDDHNTLAGVVRVHQAAKARGLRVAIGCRLTPLDAPELLCYPTDRTAYGRLSRLLSRAKSTSEKGQCRFTLDDVIAHSEGQLFLLVPPPGLRPPPAFAALTLTACQGTTSAPASEESAVARSCHGTSEPTIVRYRSRDT